MTRGILATSVLIDLHVGAVSTAVLLDEMAITSLSLGELGLGVAVAANDRVRHTERTWAATIERLTSASAR